MIVSFKKHYSVLSMVANCGLWVSPVLGRNFLFSHVKHSKLSTGNLLNDTTCSFITARLVTWRRSSMNSTFPLLILEKKKVSPGLRIIVALCHRHLLYNALYSQPRQLFRFLILHYLYFIFLKGRKERGSTNNALAKTIVLFSLSVFLFFQVDFHCDTHFDVWYVSFQQLAELFKLHVLVFIAFRIFFLGKGITSRKQERSLFWCTASRNKKILDWFPSYNSREKRMKLSVTLDLFGRILDTKLAEVICIERTDVVGGRCRLIIHFLHRLKPNSWIL